ncbi:MAG: ABC transporter substrate-binding protein, partial [Treponema sp.]|nr:ABC transporter substrate-binding protein [Treponema sp.]
NVIHIGSVICSEGAFAVVGVPYGLFYRVFIDYINQAPEYRELLGGKTVKYTIYDCKGDGAAGRSLIERLIHDDKVEALVGILGTWNLIAARSILENVGIPSVYFGTGSSAQVFQPAAGNQRYMMGVQPNYITEGRHMYLRAITQFENVRSIGVVHSAGDDGISFRRGIEQQAALDTRPNKPQVIYQSISTTDAAAIAPQIRAIQNTDVIIAAGNQASFRAIYSASYANSFSRPKPVITTYVNASPTTVPSEATNADAGPIYSMSWIPMSESNPNSADAQRRLKEVEEYVRVVDWGVSRGRIPASQREAFYFNAFSTSSYIAIKMFLTGLERLRAANLPFTAENYLRVMERERVPVALSGSVDFRNGLRIGLDTLAFVKYQPPQTGRNPLDGFFTEVDPMASIETLTERVRE